MVAKTSDRHTGPSSGHVIEKAPGGRPEFEVQAHGRRGVVKVHSDPLEIVSKEGVARPAPSKDVRVQTVDTFVVRAKVGNGAARTYVITDRGPGKQAASAIERYTLERVFKGSGKGLSKVDVSELAGAVWDADPQAALDLRSALDERLAAAAGTEADDDDLSALWGPAPTASDVEAATRDGGTEHGRALKDLRERAWTREKAGRHLHISPQAVSARIDRNDLVGVKIGRAWWLPDWQFTDDGSVGGLRRLVAAWPSSVVALDAWARERHPDLQATPAEVLRRTDGIDRVLGVLGVEADSRW